MEEIGVLATGLALPHIAYMQLKNSNICAMCVAYSELGLNLYYIFSTVRVDQKKYKQI